MACGISNFRWYDCVLSKGVSLFYEKYGDYNVVDVQRYLSNRSDVKTREIFYWISKSGCHRKMKMALFYIKAFFEWHNISVVFQRWGTDKGMNNNLFLLYDVCAMMRCHIINDGMGKSQLLLYFLSFEFFASFWFILTTLHCCSVSISSVF